MTSNLKIAIRQQLALAEWQIVRRLAAKARTGHQSKRIVFSPSDPFTLIGAKGDEAMMTAVAGEIRHWTPDLKVGVITATPRATSAALSIGFDPLPAWKEPFCLQSIMHALREYQADALFTLGADVMDGYYSPYTSLRLLTIAECAAHAGYKSTILGFSFNEHPSSILRWPFNSATRELCINVRDEVSLNRFQGFCKAPAQLVSDSAFLLDPDRSATVQKYSAWAEEQRAYGRIVLGFNIHPMLIKQASTSEISKIQDAAIIALDTACRQNKSISLILINHDYREQNGDAVCLQPIFDRLRPKLGERICFPLEKMTAAELKALAGVSDGVMTGRMHLAIASLGMGVPVLGFTYQDKFHGLFKHFGLPEGLLLAPSDVLNAEKLCASMIQFCSTLPELKKIVAGAWPTVRQRAMLNLRGIRMPN